MSHNVWVLKIPLGSEGHYYGDMGKIGQRFKKSNFVSGWCTASFCTKEHVLV